MFWIHLPLKKCCFTPLNVLPVENSPSRDNQNPEQNRLYPDKDITSFFQKHILSGEDIELTKEKWIDGFEFKIIDTIPKLEMDKSRKVQYILN